MSIKIRIAIIFILFVLVCVTYYIQLPKYKIHTSTTSEGPDYKETELQVIVYKLVESEILAKEIASQHNTMNGTPNKLTIRLYRSKYDVDCSRDFYKVVLEYEKDEVTEALNLIAYSVIE